MSFLALLFFVAIILLIVAKKFSGHFQASSQSFPYEKQRQLLTPAERSFFGVLEQAVGDSYRIFTKVRLADLFNVQSGLEPKDRLRAFNKISAKHIDFVICDPNSIEVLAAIELDDKSHAHPKRKIRDEFVNGVFNAAGVALGRVPAKKGYSMVDIHGVLSQILDIGTEIDREEKDKDFSFGEEHTSPKDGQRLKYVSKSRPLCPACGNPMEEKINDDVGGKLWVCSKAPICDETMTINTAEA
jgi:Protein of unknown function (DUF2726)